MQIIDGVPVWGEPLPEAVQQMKNQDCLNFVNKSCREKGVLNHLFGLKKCEGIIYGKIREDNKEIFWLPIWELCIEQEKFIKKWQSLGGKIE